jgi:hypothetical protein
MKSLLFTRLSLRLFCSDRSPIQPESHRRNLLRYVTPSVVIHTPLPVLTIPERGYVMISMARVGHRRDIANILVSLDMFVVRGKMAQPSWLPTVVLSYHAVDSVLPCHVTSVVPLEHRYARRARRVKARMR